MKITKFAALAGVALLAGAGAFAQATDDYNLPQGFSFYNEFGSDVAQITGNAHVDHIYDNYRSEFGGIYDKIYISYTSEKLWFELSPKWGISDRTENYYSGNEYSDLFGHGSGFNWSYRNLLTYGNTDGNGSLNSDDMGFNFWGFDWGIRFTPFDIVDFYLHKGVDIVGSSLPIRGGWGANNLGSDGFAIITKPIDGLRISAAIPFSFEVSSKQNWINAEIEDAWVTKAGEVGYPREGMGGVNRGYQFRLDLGADYTASSGLFGVGGKIENIIAAGARRYGLYGQVNFGALTAVLGYSFADNLQDNWLKPFDNDLIKIGGKQAVAAGVTFKAGELTLKAEGMYNLKNKESVYDAYAGAFVSYGVVPGKFTADLTFGAAMDFGTNAHHGTDEDTKALQNAMKTINPAFADLYYSHIVLEDLRAVYGIKDGRLTDNGAKARYDTGAAAGENWQYYTALNRSMSNGDIDNTSAAAAALALRIRPGFTYNTAKNEFGAHIDWQLFMDGDGSYQIKFPVYWKWQF